MKFNQKLSECLCFFFVMVGASLITKATCAQQQIFVKTQNNALVLQVEQDNRVHTIYFGRKLNDDKEYAFIKKMYQQGSDYTKVLDDAYTPAGNTNLMEPAITVVHAEGNRSLDLQYVSHKEQQLAKDVSLLSIDLKDPVYSFMVTLFYKTYFKEDIIEQWSSISHKEKGNVILEKYASANLYLRAKQFYLTQYHGDWAREMQPETSLITHGIKTLDTKLGTRANLFQPSVFMISLNKPATEDAGEVLYGALEYSGNFKTDIELDYLNNLRIISGINNYASPYTLKPGEVFETPAFLYLLSNTGKGDASRKMQDWARKYKLLDGNGNRLTLLNNWESTFFNFNENKLGELIRNTKELGVDLFLLDDGWFGNKYPRNDDHAGLGDWQANRKKLPDGISWLVREATENGVKFGIWIEPEMVNPKSELYEKHLDWVIRQPNRPEYYFRNQLVLDLSNPKVQDFVFGVVDSLFTENPGLAYIKWDCNSVIYNAHSSYLKNQSHFYIEYMRGLYNVLKRVRAKYPSVPMMLCSGGGGRVDYAALQYFTEYWPSDNTDPLERIYIQWEYSYFYPALASANHVTNWGKQPLKYRVDVAMMGKLGFDIPVGNLKPEDLAFCQQSVKNYDVCKDVIWHGDQYRLSSPWTNDVAAISYVSKSKDTAIVFNYLVNNRYDAGSKLPVLLKGLNPAKMYQVKEINLMPGDKSVLGSNQIYSGDFLMTAGFNPIVNRSRTSVIFTLTPTQ